MKDGGGKRGCRGSEWTELKLLVDMLLPVELRGDAVVWLVVVFFLEEKNFSSLSSLCAMVLCRCREPSVAAAIGVVVVVNNGIRRGG